MQCFLIGMIDCCLCIVGFDDFNDLCNVDVVMIYVMLGGNLVMFDMLILYDVCGNFDIWLINVFFMYFGGKGGLVNKMLDEIVLEYKIIVIGFYLVFVVVNVVMQKKLDVVLKYFDWVCFVFFGLIVEEVVLCCFFIIMVKQNNIESLICFVWFYFLCFFNLFYVVQVVEQVVILIDVYYDKIGNDCIV